MSNHQQSSIPVQLFGDDPTGPIGIQSGIGDLVVSKSGESILFTPRGAQGEALPISGVRSSDDGQVLQVVAVTQASTCTLTFDGVTTAPIPLQPLSALTSFVWKATLPRPGSYDVGLAWGIFYGGPPGVQGSTTALIEVFGSGVLLGSVTIDQSQVPDESSGGVAVQGVGVFRPVGTFNFSGTDLQVQLSGPSGSGLLLAAALRVAPVGFTNPADVGYIDPNPYRSPGSDGALEGSASFTAYGNWTATWFYTPIGSWHEGFYAMPTGTAISRFPTTSDVQAALSSLANVSPGSLNVTSPSPQSILIQFTGSMGGQSWPTLSCSDPAIQVVHDGTAGSSIGGDYPTVTVNGVAHSLHGSSYAQGKPHIAFHLIQDAPTPQYQRYGEGLFQVLNYNYFPFQDGVGYGDRIAYATQSGALANWQFQGLAGPAEFQVDITWPGGDPAADLLECAVLDGSGQVLGTVSGIDQTQAPGDSIDTTGVAWKSLGRFALPHQINSLIIQARGPGNGGKHIILDSVRLTRVSADRGAKIRPGDEVLFHMPPDYVRTASGSVASVSDVSVTPAPATRLPVIPVTPKSLKLGYNCDASTFYSIDSCFANFAAQVRQPIAPTQNAQGNPTRLSYDPGSGCGVNQAIVSVLVSDCNGRGYGVPASGPGVWVLQWTGSPQSSCDLVALPPTPAVVEITSRRTTTGLVNRCYYQVTTTNPASPNLVLRFSSTLANGDGSYQCDVSNVALFPPDVDPDSPSRWRPGFLKKLRGVQCFRFMDMLGTNNMNLSEFAHLPDQANFPLGYAGRTISVPIASIGPPTPDPFSESVAGTVVRVTTKVPHGLRTGFQVGLQTTDGSSLGQVAGNVIDPATNATTATSRDLIDPTEVLPYQPKPNLCRVIDDLTVQIGIQTYNGPLARMTNTLTPSNGILHADLAPGAMMGPDDIADLCIAAGIEPWVNVPWLATDDCVTETARVLAQRLPAGRTIHVEYGNEPWNFGFVGFGYCVRMAKLLGLPADNYTAYYTKRMGEVHQIFRDVWATLGRDPADVRRVCGVMLVSAGGSTVPCLDYAVANGISFDELAPATYYSNTPAAGPLDDLLTSAQLLDLFAMNLQMSDLPGQLASHTQACQDALARNPSLTWLGDVVLVNYEGGPETMTTTSMTANIAAMSHAVHRHPDFCEIEMNHLQILEDAGVKLFNIFTLYRVGPIYQWGVYEGYQMEAGTGDPTVDIANVVDFENLSAIKSETAAALMKWSAMIQQPAQPTKLVLRNGPALSYGQAAY